MAQVFGSLVNGVIARNRIVRSQGFSIVGTSFPYASSDQPLLNGQHHAVGATKGHTNHSSAGVFMCRWTDGPVNATSGVYGRRQQCQPARPATVENCQWWQVCRIYIILLYINIT